jgi:hypothetical protein
MAPYFAQKTTRRKQVTIYFPTHGWNMLPGATAVALSLVVLANAFSLLKTDDWSAISIELHLLTDLIILSLIGLSLLIVYCLLRILSPFCIIDSDTFVIVRKGRAKEYLLGEIDSFLITNTASTVMDRPILKIELYILNSQLEKEQIFSNEIANRLQRSWKKTAEKLTEATRRMVSIEYFVEDPDGRVYELKIYRERQSEKDARMSLFKDIQS